MRQVLSARRSSSPGSRRSSRRTAIRPNTAGFGRTGLKLGVRSVRSQGRKKRGLLLSEHLGQTPSTSRRWLGDRDRRRAARSHGADLVLANTALRSHQHELVAGAEAGACSLELAISCELREVSTRSAPLSSGRSGLSRQAGLAASGARGRVSNHAGRAPFLACGSHGHKRRRGERSAGSLTVRGTTPRPYPP